MPYRKVVFAPGETYHIFNRGIAKQPIFLNPKHYQRFYNTIDFYRYENPHLSYSHYLRLNLNDKLIFENNLNTLKRSVEIISFCLMPNHFHFILTELIENGLTLFISNLQNSYAKYFNQITSRTGSLFEAMFKAVRIESEEQLLHVVRYVHLNPVTSYIIKDYSQLNSYLWSSHYDYIGNRIKSFVNSAIILDQFKTLPDYEKFINNQIEYQRELLKIKHLLLEN